MGNNDTRLKAAEWLVELKTSDDIDALWPAFHAWLQEAPENQSVYLELESVWRISERAMAPVDRVRSDAAARFAAEVRGVLAKRQLNRTWALGTGVVVAAVVAAIGTLLTFFMSHAVRHMTSVHYETKYGEHRPVSLADGSVIDLNTNSRVSARISEDVREVTLEWGEAFFTVAHDPSHPFKVKVDSDVLTAKGTQFSVRREAAGRVSTLVLEGRVEVPNHNGVKGSNGQVSSQPLIADSGTAVVITPGHTEVEDIGPAAVQDRIAWTGGNIVIDGTLADAIEEFNRYSKRRLEIANPLYAGRHIQGIFKATDPDAFAQAVESNLKIPWTSTGAAKDKTGVIRLGASQ